MNLSRVRGREFEKKVFGHCWHGSFQGRNLRPDYLDLRQSMSRVVDLNWALYAEAIEKGDEKHHNPAKPSLGKTGVLWSAVSNFLPGDKRQMPLNLYVSIGRNSLDHHHGVDAFFWWLGGYATIDVSTRRKGGRSLKADFVLVPGELRKPQIFSFGNRVARLLRDRSEAATQRERIQSEKSVVIAATLGLGQ